MHDKNDHLSRHLLFVFFSAMGGADNGDSVRHIASRVASHQDGGLRVQPINHCRRSRWKSRTSSPRSEAHRQRRSRTATGLTLPLNHQVFDTPKVPATAPPQVLKQGLDNTIRGLCATFGIRLAGGTCLKRGAAGTGLPAPAVSVNQKLMRSPTWAPWMS